MTDLFPSILPGNDGEEQFVDDEYQRAELEALEWQELRSLAAEHPTDEVSGRMGREEIEAGLIGKTRLEALGGNGERPAHADAEDGSDADT